LIRGAISDLGQIEASRCLTTISPTSPTTPPQRVVLGAVTKRFPALPFTLRALTEVEGGASEATKQLRLGLVECLAHGLLHPYPVLHEKGGELVAQVRVRVCVCVCRGGCGGVPICMLRGWCVFSPLY
jgi:hypothetical protein